MSSEPGPSQQQPPGPETLDEQARVSADDLATRQDAQAVTPAIHLLSFLAFTLLLVWPIASIAGRRGGTGLLAYITGVWLLATLTLFLLGRRARKTL